MNALTRWDPFREMVDMRREMDRLLQTALSGQEGMQTWALPLNVSETEDAYEIEASLPGVSPEDVEITLNNNTLTISGEVKQEEEKEDRTYHVRERRYGSFVRSITLPSAIKSDAIEARFENGVLKLRVPKAEEAKPKRIQIQNGGESRMIEGEPEGARQQ
jgi:HSP20 family protein